MLNVRQSDGSLPEVTLLHLQSTSTMIDKGTNVGYTFFGTAPDLGAYEYSTTTAVSEINSSESDVLIYYSAGNSEINIKGSISSVDVFEYSGRKVYSKNIETDNLSIPANNFKRSIYLVRVTSAEGKTLVRKILVD